MESERTQSAANSRHRGPNLAALGIVYTLLFLGSLVVTAIMTGTHFPSPCDPQGAAQVFFTENADAVRVAAFLQFGAAIPLGIFAVAAVSRPQFLGINVAGVFISLFGGLVASLFADVSGLSQWVLGQPGIAAQGTVMHALHLLAFATGGPGFVVPFGLLMAGVSVVCWFTKLLPRWLVWSGILLAAIAELASLSLIFTPAGYLLPLARFLGLVWMIATRFKLPRSRNVAQTMRSEQSAA